MRFNIGEVSIKYMMSKVNKSKYFLKDKDEDPKLSHRLKGTSKTEDKSRNKVDALSVIDK